MGEVVKPENLVGKRKTRFPDIFPKPLISPSPPILQTIEDLKLEIQALKNELEKIKRALRKHGVLIE